MMMNEDQPVLILGAGMAGLSAARRLQEAGRRVIVLDKGRGVGGRMATRRFEDGRFDHGAQFFTSRDPGFGQRLAGWQDAGAAALWSHGFAGPDGVWLPDGHPRYRGAAGMTSVPKLLAEGLDVRLETEVTAVRRHGARWQVFTKDAPDAPLLGAALILTPPVPQSLALLAAGDERLPAALQTRLGAIRYAPCLALLVLLDGPSKVPAPGGLQLGTEPVAWIGDNRQKGISTAHALTIHGAPGFSAARWAAETPVVAAQLLAAAQPWLGSAVRSWQLVRWRYSLPLNPFAERFLSLPGPAPLFFAGDAFGGPRVEGAALSGTAVAQALLAGQPGPA